METLINDIRYAIRSCVKNRRLTLVIVFTLAVGIGASAALFTVVNAVVLRPLRYKDSGRLVRLYESNAKKDAAFFSVSAPNYLDWKQQTQAFDDLGALTRPEDFSLVDRAEPEQVSASRVSANLLTMLGVEPMLGRGFLAEDDQPNHEPVILLGHGLWERRFGKDRNVIGQPITLSGQTYTIIGVMPEDFELPFNDGQMYLPLRFSEQDLNRSRRYLRVMGHLRPGVSLEQAQADLNLIGLHLEQQYTDSNEGWGVSMKTVKRVVVPDDFQSSLWLLLGAVGLVLLIACVNVANLLSARATARSKEIAIRTALGASRLRLIRQLLTESAVMSVAAGALGILIAYWGVTLLLTINPEDIPRFKEIKVDWSVLGFAFGVSFLTATLFGIIPAFQSSKADVSSCLKEASRGSSGGPGQRRVRNTMVILEVALALLVIIGAGLVLKSFRRVMEVNPGFDPNHVMTLSLSLSESRYPKREAVENFYRQLHEGLGAVPNVVSVGLTNSVPMGGSNTMNTFSIVGRPQGPNDSEAAAFRVVSPGYFSTMKIPLVTGRTFDDHETRESPRVMVIDESMQKRHWANEDPLGKYLRFGGPNEAPFMIIGVVRDVRRDGLDAETLPTMYLSTYQARPQPATSLVVRTQGDPSTQISALRNAIWRLDSQQAIANMQTMDNIVSKSLSGRRFNLTIFGVFALIAIILAAVGIYSVISYSVTQRVHEFGIRIALGAQRANVLSMVVRQGLALATAGVAIGLTASFLLTRIISKMLFQVSPVDVTTFLIASALSLILAPAACLLPARRATRVNPLIALREE